MLQKLKENLFGVIAATFSLIVALFWLALRVNWSGISKALGADNNPSFIVMELPLLICIFLWLSFVFAIVAMFVWRGKKWPFILSVCISGVFTIVSAVVVALGAIDYLAFILPKFGLSLLVTAAIILFALILFFPIDNKKRIAVILKCALLCIVILSSVLIGYNIKGNTITYDSVVYAVEDNYQIVFSTSDQSIAWVEIDGQKYYDLYAGSMKSNDLVHKIEVPQSALDNAKSYTICAQQMIYRGPFGGYKGKIISKTHDFRPVNTADGLKYYTMSDVHAAYRGAVNAASQHSNMDFLILAGDLYSMLESEQDAQFANKLAFGITKGEFPVVYARGNHEVKGLYAEDLHKYVGSKNGNFYYTFTLSNEVFGIVLDIGEDHDDDWWEYYGTAQFVQYQQEQTQMLDDIKSRNVANNYDYTLAVSHIPIPFVNYRKNHTEVKAEWTSLLNDIGIDMFLSGHQHTLYPFIPNTVTPFEKLTYSQAYSGTSGKTYSGYYTDFDFPGFIVSRRGDTQLDEVGPLNRTKFIGLITDVDLTLGKQTCKYTNAKGETVHIANPFYDEEYDVFTLDLN